MPFIQARFGLVGFQTGGILKDWGTYSSKSLAFGAINACHNGLLPPYSASAFSISTDKSTAFTSGAKVMMLRYHCTPSKKPKRDLEPKRLHDLL